MLSLDLFWEEYEEQHVADDAQDEHNEDHDPAHRKLNVRHQLVTLPELEQCHIVHVQFFREYPPKLLKKTWPKMCFEHKKFFV